MPLLVGVRMIQKIFFVLVLTSVITGAHAAERNVTASNGINVSITGDDFDGKLEFTAPKLKISDDEYSFLFVAIVKKTGQPAGSVQLAGSLYYDGDWRRYHEAKFRGGEVAKGDFNDRDVLSCRSSSSECTLREGFHVWLTDAQIQKYAVGAYIDLKFKASKSSEEPVVSVPISYIEAVKEVSRSGRF